MRLRNPVLAASLAITVLLGLAAAHGAEPQAAEPQKAGPTGGPLAYTLTGPFVHENLSIFLIHGTNRLKDKSYLTLQEAMEKKVVIVHETGNVNELAIENVSPDVSV